MDLSDVVKVCSKIEQLPKGLLSLAGLSVDTDPNSAEQGKVSASVDDAEDLFSAALSGPLLTEARNIGNSLGVGDMVSKAKNFFGLGSSDQVGELDALNAVADGDVNAKSDLLSNFVGRLIKPVKDEISQVFPNGVSDPISFASKADDMLAALDNIKNPIENELAALSDGDIYSRMSVLCDLLLPEKALEVQSAS